MRTPLAIQSPDLRRNCGSSPAVSYRFVTLANAASHAEASTSREPLGTVRLPYASRTSKAERQWDGEAQPVGVAQPRPPALAAAARRRRPPSGPAAAAPPRVFKAFDFCLALKRGQRASYRAFARYGLR